MSRAGFWFLVVGTAAAITHQGVYYLAHPYMWEELAVAVGFVIAFCVSFLGHRLLSFNDTSNSVGQSLLRFGITALAGLATNEVVFVVFLRGLGVSGMWALLAGQVVAAGQTFVLSRFWAFRR